MALTVQFTANLVDLRRAVLRLTMRLGDESPIGEGFVILRVALKRLTIETVNSSEELSLKSTKSELSTCPLLCSVPSRKLFAITVANESNSVSPLAVSAWIER
jgi:hypothetical protein